MALAWEELATMKAMRSVHALEAAPMVMGTTLILLRQIYAEKGQQLVATMACRLVRGKQEWSEAAFGLSGCGARVHGSREHHEAQGSHDQPYGAEVDPQNTRELQPLGSVPASRALSGRAHECTHGSGAVRLELHVWLNYRCRSGIRGCGGGIRECSAVQ